MMSAGSHTEPGGYTGQGRDKLHQTIRGRQIAADGEAAEGQFAISDGRPPIEVAQRLRELGLDPVWKDWDAAILNAA
jgi:2-iminoacetate synthase